MIFTNFSVNGKVIYIGRKLDAKKQQEPQPKPVASKTF